MGGGFSKSAVPGERGGSFSGQCQVSVANICTGCEKIGVGPIETEKLLGMISEITKNKPETTEFFLKAVATYLHLNLNSKLPPRELLEKIDYSIDFVNERFGEENKELPKELNVLFGMLKNDNFEMSVLEEGTLNNIYDLIATVSKSRGAEDEFDISDVSQMLWGSKDFVNTLPGIVENYEEGKRMAGKLGLPESTEININFAYALSVIGRKNTLMLHKWFGIERFMRYTKKTLDSFVKNTDPSHEPDKPVLVAAFNKHDPTREAFYEEGTELEKLIDGYKLLIVEVGTEDEFYKRVGDMGRGYGKINTLIIAAHGTPNHLYLGGERDENSLDITEEVELKKLREHLDYTVKPKIILAACSTGILERNLLSISKTISRALDAEVLSPTQSYTQSNYRMNWMGHIAGITYYANNNWVPTVYHAGGEAIGYHLDVETYEKLRRTEPLLQRYSPLPEKRIGLIPKRKED